MKDIPSLELKNLVRKLYVIIRPHFKLVCLKIFKEIMKSSALVLTQNPRNFPHYRTSQLRANSKITMNVPTYLPNFSDPLFVISLDSLK
jgi:hypothetical protein